LRRKKTGGKNRGTGEKGQFVASFYAVVLFRAVIIADNRLRALPYSHERHNYNDKHAEGNCHGGKRLFSAVFQNRGVL